jgi:allophycocyanin-B
MSTQLSEKAKQLIQKARIVSFASWQEKYPERVIAIFQKADDEGRYLSDRDSEEIQILAPDRLSDLEKAKLLRDNANEIVALARQEVLAQYPNISEPGGDLYPPARAEACWRDFWHFLRCVTYGIAGRSLRFTSAEGMYYMEELYQELKVPLAAMVLGLENLKKYSLQKFSASEHQEIGNYFDRFIIQLKGFSGKK